MIAWLSATTAEVEPGDTWLVDAERDVQRALVVEKRRGDWRLGRWTAKRAVAALLGVDARSLEIRAAGDGAPEAWHGGRRLPVSLSLSHSDGVALCAVAEPDVAVGCDVELVEHRDPAFVREWFLPSERGMVAATAEAHRDVVTTMLWSAKESALKRLRCGLRRDPLSLQVHGGDLLPVHGWLPLHVHDLAGNGDSDAWWHVRGTLVATVAAGPMPVPPRRLRCTRTA